LQKGFGRESGKELLRFLNIFVGSLFEMQTQLKISNISYLKEYDFNNLYEDSREVVRMLVSFIKKIKDRN
jgi:four helix bundle protein